MGNCLAISITIGKHKHICLCICVCLCMQIYVRVSGLDGWGWRPTIIIGGKIEATYSMFRVSSPEWEHYDLYLERWTAIKQALRAGFWGGHKDGWRSPSADTEGPLCDTHILPLVLCREPGGRRRDAVRREPLDALARATVAGCGSCTNSASGAAAV